MRFAQHPVRAFLRQRLGISVGGLLRRGRGRPAGRARRPRAVGRRSAAARRACSPACDGRAAILAEIARGTLPPGVLGKPVDRRRVPDRRGDRDGGGGAGRGPGRAARLDRRPRRARRTGATLSGTVPGVSGDVLRTVTYSRLLREAPARGVGAAARADGRASRSGRSRRPRSDAATGERAVTVARIRPLGPDAAARREAALAHLATLVDLYDRGMREPLPLYCLTSAAYAEAAAAGDDAVAAARRGLDVRVELRQGGQGARAPARARRRADASTSCSPSRRARRGGRRLGADRDDAASAAAPAGMWAGLLACEEVRPGERRTPRACRSTSAGPLPTGVTVLEASAGTGKTYTIAALAARYVAEGTPLDELLLVTFTRMATGELRERVRERLVSVEQGLARALAGVAAERPTTRSSQLLADGPRCRGAAPARSARARARRLRRGHDRHDPRVLPGGARRPRDRRATSSATRRSSRTSATSSRRSSTTSTCGASTADDAPPFGRAEAAAIARDRRSRTRPRRSRPPTGRGPGDAPPARRSPCATELERRKRRLAVMTYDDLLTRLDDTLAGDGGQRRGRAAARALRRRARRRVPGHRPRPVGHRAARVRRGRATLVLIGDPKQAIYAFRGADVYAYLEAARTAGTRATLEVNWRSDQGLIDAYDALFGGAKLGHEGIVYRRVRAADANQAPRLTGAPRDAPLRIRVVHRDEPSIALTRTGYAATPQRARAHRRGPRRRPRRAAVVAAREIERRSEDGATARAASACGPGHVAVLVRTNRNAALIRDALDDVGIPAVINGAGSVFGTRAGARVAAPARGDRAPDARRPARARPRSRASSAGRAEQVAAATRTPGRRSTAGCTTGRACCACRASRR